MHLRSKEFLRQKARKKLQYFSREYGQVQWIQGYFFLLFLAVILCSRLQVDVYRTSALYLEDALAASTLASAVIDVEEYGRTHNILVDNPYAAYERFCVAVKGNLQLDDNWECGNKGLISGAVQVANYTIYNVKDELVMVYEMESGSIREWQGVLGSVNAPDGTLIEETSIYSELIFPVESFGFVTQAHMGQLVDIVTNEEE